MGGSSRAVERPFSAIYHSRAYYALEVEPRDTGAEIRLWRCKKSGDEQQQRIDMLVNAQAGRIIQRRAVRNALGALADRVVRARGYRDRAARPELDRTGSTLSLSDETGSWSVTAAPTEARGELGVRVASSLGPDTELKVTPTSLVRLAAWVRLKFSSRARETLEARHAWAADLAAAIDARLERVDRAGSALVMDLRMERLPAPEVLQRWLMRLRDEQADAP